MSEDEKARLAGLFHLLTLVFRGAGDCVGRQKLTAK